MCSFTEPFIQQINSAKMFFFWLRNTLLPRLFPVADIRGQAISVLDKQFFSDFSHARVGPAILRQSRMTYCEYKSFIIKAIF